MQKLCALFVVSTAALVLLGRSTHALRRINCRMFPYARPCRGVAAKRADGSALSSLDDTYFVVPSQDENRNDNVYHSHKPNQKEDDLRKLPSYFTKSPLRNREPGLAQAQSEAPQPSWRDLYRMSTRMRQGERMKDGRLNGLNMPSTRIYRPTVQSTQAYLEALLQHRLNSKKQ